MTFSYVFRLVITSIFLLGCSQNRFGNEPKVLENGLNTDPIDIGIDTNTDAEEDSETDLPEGTDSDTHRDADTITGVGADTETDSPIDIGTDTTVDGGTIDDTDEDAGVRVDSDSDISSDTETSPPLDTDSTSDTGPVMDTEPDTGTGYPEVDTDEHLDPNAVPADVPTVRIEVDPLLIEFLEEDPFTAPDVAGNFIDASGKRYEEVDVNYRGAYALQSLMDEGRRQRNWKVKFPSDDKYENRREWNFNYEPNMRQRLAYDLMKLAGVKMPTARHVLLYVNDELQGLYLQYEDPDSKDWLWDRFGWDDGDLYKAATDIPNEPRYFADLTYLGDQDSDYFYHYRKMTNHKVAPDDYSVLRQFLHDLNTLPDEAFADWLRSVFNVDSFISYLAVSNFIANWDSYHPRPKNYWLYNNSSNGIWTYIPWDIDSTFQLSTWHLNNMGPEAPIFYMFDGEDPAISREPEESGDRPLVFRMMAQAEFRDAYVARYKELIQTTLDQGYILNRLEKLTALVDPVAPSEDVDSVHNENGEIEEFVRRRYENVTGQLSDG